jgi:hypothetical protein
METYRWGPSPLRFGDANTGANGDRSLAGLGEELYIDSILSNSKNLSDETRNIITDHYSMVFKAAQELGSLGNGEFLKKNIWNEFFIRIFAK